MNIIDKNFKDLVTNINSKTKEEIFDHIKKSYQKIPEETKNSLEKFLTNFPYWGNLHRNEGNYEELYNRTISLKEHLNDYIWLYEHLEDYRSKKLLFAILSNWYSFDFKNLSTSIEKNYPHYFDLDLVKCNENEIFVDIGAYTGDTVLEYLDNYGFENYKKIYCYEITDNSFKILQNNLKYYSNIIFRQKAISDSNLNLFIEPNKTDSSANKINFSGTVKIDTTTIDCDIKEPITLIKMDIEGGEEKALLGCKHHIKNDHPKLLISVYHNHKDLFKIPLIINSFNSNYKFYLRNYGNIIFPTETVLIAIPKK